MRLAAGDWAGAAGGYQVLLDGSSLTGSRPRRGPARTGGVGGRARITGARPSPPPGKRYGCSRGAGRVADAALARYWLAYGTYLSDNEGDARTQLQDCSRRPEPACRSSPSSKCAS